MIFFSFPIQIHCILKSIIASSRE